MEQGKILEEPIPQIKWLGHPNRDAENNIEKCLNYSSSRMGSGSFNNFVDWLLYGFGDSAVNEFPRQIDKETNSFWYRTFNLGLLLQHPYDYLGQLACDRKGSGKWNNPTAFFPTPMNVCEMMAQITMQEADKTSSVCDPCIGSGRMLLSASNYSLNLYGMDIDLGILKVCKVNMWQYVPWAITRSGVSGFESESQSQSENAIQQGNALAVHPIQKITPEVQQQLLDRGGQIRLF